MRNIAQRRAGRGSCRVGDSGRYGSAAPRFATRIGVRGSESTRISVRAGVRNARAGARPGLVTAAEEIVLGGMGSTRGVYGVRIDRCDLAGVFLALVKIARPTRTRPKWQYS